MEFPVKAGHDVLRERFRLAAEHGVDAIDHDRPPPDGAYARAAVHVLAEGSLRRSIQDVPPFAAEARHLSRRSALVRAAALLILEIERIDDQAPSIAAIGDNDEDLA